VMAVMRFDMLDPLGLSNVKAAWPATRLRVLGPSQAGC